MKFSKIRLASAQIATAPMADIAFLLIIFFMLTSVISSDKGIEHFLVDGDDDSQRPLIVKVLADGHVLLGDQSYLTTDKAAIEAHLRLRYNTAANTQAILITDDHATYGDAISLLDLLRSNQFEVGLPIGIQRDFFK